MQLRVFVGPTYFKDNLRTIEAQFPKKLRTTEAHFEFTGPYKKKACNTDMVVWLIPVIFREFDEFVTHGWTDRLTDELINGLMYTLIETE